MGRELLARTKVNGERGSGRWGSDRAATPNCVWWKFALHGVTHGGSYGYIELRAVKVPVTPNCAWWKLPLNGVTYGGSSGYIELRTVEVISSERCTESKIGALGGSIKMLL